MLSLTGSKAADPLVGFSTGAVASTCRTRFHKCVLMLMSSKERKAMFK